MLKRNGVFFAVVMNEWNGSVFLFSSVTAWFSTRSLSDCLTALCVRPSGQIATPLAKPSLTRGLRGTVSQTFGKSVLSESCHL